MLPRAASLTNARVALGGAAATASTAAVAHTPSSNPPPSRGQASLQEPLVAEGDDSGWVVADVLHGPLLQPQEIDRELDLIINLGSQHLVMLDHRTPSVASDVLSVDSGDAEAIMHASQSRIETTSHEVSLLRRAVHDLLSDAASQAALFQAVQRSEAVRELLQANDIALLPYGYAACEEALRGQEHKDRVGDALRAAGDGLLNLGAALGKQLHGMGMAVLEFFAGLGKQVREAATKAELQALGGVVALATGVFVMALLRRAQRA